MLKASILAVATTGVTTHLIGRICQVISLLSKCIKFLMKLTQARSAMKHIVLFYGEEDCETCDHFHQNKYSHGHLINMEELHKYLDGEQDRGDQPIGCELCNKWVRHMKATTKSRRHFQDDVTKNSTSTDSIVCSAGMQNAIMLPRIPGNKTAMFTRQITAYHETFGTVGKKSEIPIKNTIFCSLA